MKMIRRKILLAAIVGIALVGVAVAALAIRSTRNDAVTAANSDAATAANSSEIPTQADQAKSTADQSTTNNAYQTENPRVASNGRSARGYSGRSVYYNYEEQPRGRTFWQKHRDKLTVAGGVGAGALVGGLIGGKKGAGIGILSGGAGSALYTYKLRHKRH
jgi:hypothetical protein